MDKAFIINEIRRLAAENDGRPPGQAIFLKRTGIKFSDWYGKYWARWNDAVTEAGFEGRALNSSYDREFVAEKFVSLIQEIGRFPVTGELRLKANTDPDFPSHNTFQSHLGKQSEKAASVISYCKEKGGLEEVIEICLPHVNQTNGPATKVDDGDEICGYVYLIKSGKYYKIGRTNAPDRRQYEIGLQLPEELVPIHSIETDDPAGIEAYWHNRFKAKRLKGEWFDLNPDEVRKFRRRKFM